MSMEGFTVTCDNCGVKTRIFNGEGEVLDYPDMWCPKGSLFFGETLRDNDNILIEAGYDADIGIYCNHCENSAADYATGKPK